MHRQIDAAVEQSLLDLLGEEALAPDLGEHAILNAVATRSNGNDLDRPRRSKIRVSRGEAVANKHGLMQCHRAAAGTDAQGVERHGDLLARAATLGIRAAEYASAPARRPRSRSTGSRSEHRRGHVRGRLAPLPSGRHAPQSARLSGSRSTADCPQGSTKVPSHKARPAARSAIAPE